MLCILFVDQPVALYVNGHTALRHLFQLCAAPSLLTLPLAGLFLVWAVWQKLRGQPPVSSLWMTVSVATLASTAAKDELKWIFGRPWPDTWMRWGTYGFRPLTDNVFFGSFPSGHTAYIAAPLCVLWVLAPRHRLLWGGVIFLVMLGLVGANYHFVADVLAGLETGWLCAWGTLILLKPARG